MIESALALLLLAAPDWRAAVAAAAANPKHVPRYEELVDLETFASRALVDAELTPEERAAVTRALATRVKRRLDRWARSDARPDCTITAKRHDLLGLDCTVKSERHQVVLELARDGRAIDVEVDGALLSRNYRARMNRALRTKSAKEVIADLGKEPEGSPLTP